MLNRSYVDSTTAKKQAVVEQRSSETDNAMDVVEGKPENSLEMLDVKYVFKRH